MSMGFKPILSVLVSVIVNTSLENRLQCHVHDGRYLQTQHVANSVHHGRRGMVKFNNYSHLKARKSQ